MFKNLGSLLALAFIGLACVCSYASPTQRNAASPGVIPVPLPRLGGVNTAGYDFSASIDGSFTGNGVDPPLGQYPHFTAQRVNIYRIPFGWQLMTPTLGGPIDPVFFARYNNTVQAALSSGPNVWVIIDVHNYARWNGQIIAQGGPTNDEFISLWTQLSEKFQNEPRVIFGIMNEPHDLISVPTWADTLQQVVTAIRNSGAENYLLLPGSSWSSAEAFPTEAGPLLVNITNPDGGNDRLIFDVHKYLDVDNSGGHAECVTNNVQVFQNLVNFLRENGNRQAILSETGGGNTESCFTLFEQELRFVRDNFPTLAGYTVWSAGAFDTTYVTTVTPFTNGTDQPIWINAVVPNLP
ncbi:glycoside hydrolase superfamily [Irpex rosettiformis]|uniref:Glycoside hydrolase superfamily n=1 Tax=Irpex rosettiformis TaxID=378272 RepID=A0ACB8TPZ7_9APHY|nr:glycoside hydrolase superfamily [Irpex rosettiformis]